MLLLSTPNMSEVLSRCDMEEVKDEEASTMNEGEAAVSIAHAKLLVESGVRASDVGIITPYAAQVFGPLPPWIP